MGRTIKRVGKLCLYVVEPVPRLAELHQWLGLLPGAAIVIGLIVTAISGLVGDPLWIVVYVLALLLLMTFWAAYRLFARVEALEAPPARPHNWEAIIVALRAWEVIAKKLIMKHRVCSNLRREYPDRDLEFRVKFESWDEYDGLLNALKTQFDIAGSAFNKFMEVEYRIAEMAASHFKYDQAIYDDDKYEKADDDLTKHVGHLVSQLSNSR